MGSTFGRHLRLTTFGESHGIAVGGVLENVPAGMELCENDIQPDMDRRRPGQSRISTPRNEADKIEIVSGVFEGKTTGAPIAFMVHNENTRGKDYDYFRNVYRPSHADFTYDQRYGFRAHVGGGRSSARTTLAIVAGGAIARKMLLEKCKIQICAYVSQVHDLKLADDFAIDDIHWLQKIIEENPVRIPDPVLAEKIAKRIQQARQDGDSLGGIISAIAENVPAGLGDPVFDRLDALLAHAMLAIPATKGVEFGSGFSCAEMTGSQHNDIFYNAGGKIRTRTNYSGGIQGGISNGEPITMRIAFKPTATINREQSTVDKDGNEIMLKVAGRHDPCVLPRAVVIVEAFIALVLADQYLLSLSANYNLLARK